MANVVQEETARGAARGGWRASIIHIKANVVQEETARGAARGGWRASIIHINVNNQHNNNSRK